MRPLDVVREGVVDMDRLGEMKIPPLFHTPYAVLQPQPFELSDAPWPKALKVGKYALR